MTLLVYVRNIYVLFFMCLVANEAYKQEFSYLNKLLADESTQQLSDQLLPSIEKKFQLDLKRSLDSVMIKIKSILQNGTSHIQDKLTELQSVLDDMRNRNAELVEKCLLKKENATTTLIEKALHQMVVCGYALIGHDPAQAIKSVIELKNMISEGLNSVFEDKDEIHKLIKTCRQEQDSLGKTIKCVISKSQQLKSAMVAVSQKLEDGIVHITKLISHGAMHEACLIEVIKAVEEEALTLADNVKECVAKGENTEVTNTNKVIELSGLHDLVEQKTNVTVSNAKLTPKEGLQLEGVKSKEKANAFKKLLRRIMIENNKEEKLNDRLLETLDKPQ